MDGRQERLTGSVQRRLSITLALAITVMAVVAGAFAFLAAYDEARELQDDVLRRIAQLVEAQRRATASTPLDMHVQGEEDDTRVIIQGLGGATAHRHHNEPGERLALSATLPDGLRTLELDGEPYRVLVRTTATGERFAVMQDLRLRRELARYGALRTVLPFVLLVPVLLLVLSRLVRELFRPITTLAQEVDARDEHDLRPIPDAPVPAEVRPFVRAINRLLARVDEAMQGQRRFVADAAHELRSPLTALSLQAERLAASDLSASARERLLSLRQGIDRGRDLVEQLLTLERSRSATQARLQPLSLQAGFRRVLEELMPLAESRRIDVGVQGEQDATLQAAGDALHALVRNLVDNAIRYTPEGGRVDLSVLVQAGRCGLRVADNGPGIAPEQRERIFEPFYRIPGNEQIGSGLGLAIVRGTAQAMGAQIVLEDTDKPHRSGLTVTVWFPPGIHRA